MLETVFYSPSDETFQSPNLMVPEPSRQHFANEVDPSVPLWSHRRLPESPHGTPAYECTGFAWTVPNIDSDTSHSSASSPLQQPRIANTPPIPQWPSQLGDIVSRRTPLCEQYLPMTTMPIDPLPTTSIEDGMSIRSRPKSKPRRTLTDEDRKRMCEYAQANPGMKQIDIGRPCTVADLLNVPY